MRYLILMTGSPGSGKSTWIKDHGLKPYTICPDDIRLMFQTPVITPEGSTSISQKNDKDVWEILFRMLEKRMERGEFTVIDATHSTTDSMNAYKKYAEKHRYRVFAVSFRDIPFHECVQRNLNREPLKIVPFEVIQRSYARYETEAGRIPSYIKVLMPGSEKTINYNVHDMNNYKRIHHIGDIHGCFDVLMKYFSEVGVDPNNLPADELFIFTGDYIDRGIQNYEVVQYLLSIYAKSNVIMLEGNHEKWLRQYAHDTIEPNCSKEFIKTMKQFYTHPIDKKKLREFTRHLAQLTIYDYGLYKVMVTHGGLPFIPKNPLLVSTQQIINGVGGYNDITIVDESFSKTSNESNLYYCISIHGHRNKMDEPIQSSKYTYNLEGKVEFGGMLRCVTLDKSGIKTFEIKNDVFAAPELISKSENDLSGTALTINELFNALNTSKFINSVNVYGDIYSFNFTKQAFKLNEWNDLTKLARGLFIDKANMKIVARGWPKFFNENEPEVNNIQELSLRIAYPLSVYLKYNGFLGLLGYDGSDFIMASKSSTNAFHAMLFTTMMRNRHGAKFNELREYMSASNTTLLFEVIDCVEDPHIIYYPEPRIVLLAEVKNDIDFVQTPYNELLELGRRFGFEVKQLVQVINNKNELFSLIDSTKGINTSNPIEGYVIEDSGGYMLKVKTEYYRYWKMMRAIQHNIINSSNQSFRGLFTPEAIRFVQFMKNKQRFELMEKSIIQLRMEFNEEYFKATA